MHIPIHTLIVKSTHLWFWVCALLSYHFPITIR